MVIVTTPLTTTDQTDGTTPVACTLAPAGLAAQVGRWERLIARAMTGRIETADGLRIAFRPGPATENELHSLVAVENECCSWAAWTMETNAEATVLDVRAAGPGIATLHGRAEGVPDLPGHDELRQPDRTRLAPGRVRRRAAPRRPRSPWPGC